MNDCLQDYKHELNKSRWTLIQLIASSLDISLDDKVTHEQFWVSVKKRLETLPYPTSIVNITLTAVRSDLFGYDMNYIDMTFFLDAFDVTKYEYKDWDTIVVLLKRKATTDTEIYTKMRSLIGDVKIRNQFVGAIDPYPNFLEKFDTFPQNDRKSWLSYLICGIMMQIIECDEYHFLAKRVRAIDEIAKSKFGTFTRIQNTLKENAEKLASHLKEISKLQDSIRLKEITIEIGINYPPIVVSVKMVFEIEE